MSGDAPSKTNHQTRKCGNCMWWSHIEGIVSEQLGGCRGAPPHVNDHDNYARWPVTGENDWCGAFRMKEPGQ